LNLFGLSNEVGSSNWCLFLLKNKKVYSLSKEMDMLSWVMGDLIGGVLKGQGKVAFFNN
jgi:hypothetical protein